MSLGSYDPGSRYRRRSAERRRRVFNILAILLIVGGMGYWLGKISVRSQAEAARAQAETADAEKEQLLAEVTALRAQVQEAQIRLSQHGAVPAIQQDLSIPPADESPEGPAVVATPRDCTAKEVRQLLMGTTDIKVPVNTVNFSSDLITVSGRGEAVMNTEGGAEAWFDPGKPVHVQFAIKEGPSEEKVLLLPFQHAIVHAGREYRFSLASGPQSFVEVVADSCAKP